MQKFNLSLLFCALLVSGCALVDQYQCKRLNLYQMGQNDAENGAFKQNLNEKIRTCKKYNPNLHIAQYNAGYAKGLKRYCDPSYAYQLLNWKTQLGLKDMVKSVWKWQKTLKKKSCGKSCGCRSKKK